MELVTKKRLMLCRGPRATRSCPQEIADAPEGAARRRHAVDVRERRDLLPLRREHPRRRRVRVPDALRADQRPHHGAADHDRRREARVGEAHHRGRARSTATRARTGRPRAASRSPRGSSPTCSPSPAPTASSPSTCTPARSRASSTIPVDHLTAVPVLAEYLRRDASTARSRCSSRPTPAAASSPAASPTGSSGRHRVHRQAPPEGHAQRRRSRPRSSARSTAARACSSTT